MILTALKIGMMSNIKIHAHIINFNCVFLETTFFKLAGKIQKNYLTDSNEPKLFSYIITNNPT